MKTQGCGVGLSEVFLLACIYIYIYILFFLRRIFIEHFGFFLWVNSMCKFDLLVVYWRNANMMSYFMGFLIGIYPKSKYNAFTLSISMPNNCSISMSRITVPKVFFEQNWIWLLSTLHGFDSKWFAQKSQLVKSKKCNKSTITSLRSLKFISKLHPLDPPQNIPPDLLTPKQDPPFSPPKRPWHGAPWKAPF